MELSLLDVLAFVVFLSAVIGISLYVSRKEENTEDYFLAGRHLTWWLDLTLGIWLIGLLAGAYTIYGGLKAVVWSDLLQGATLLIGGAVVTVIGFEKSGQVCLHCLQTCHFFPKGGFENGSALRYCPQSAYSTALLEDT